MAVLFNLPCYPPDSHQSHNAVYWRIGRGTEWTNKYNLSVSTHWQQ